MRHGVPGSQVLFLFQVFHVHLHVGRLLVLLRVSRHAILEFLARVLYRRAVYEESLVEAVHLRRELGGVRPAACCRGEHLVVFRLVAAQQQHVAYAEKLHVDELVFNVLLRGTRADDVRHHSGVVASLYGRRHGYGARPAPYPEPLVLPVGGLAVDVF